MSSTTSDAELKTRHRAMWASGNYPSMVETFLLPLDVVDVPGDGLDLLGHGVREALRELLVELGEDSDNQNRAEDHTHGLQRDGQQDRRR